jgi:hypothetical protein
MPIIVIRPQIRSNPGTASKETLFRISIRVTVIAAIGDEPRLRVQEANLPPLPLELPLDGLARQQRPHHAQVLPQVGQPHGAEPMVFRPVKPVPTPKSIRPGASLFSDASALAVTGAMRFEGISPD